MASVSDVDFGDSLFSGTSRADIVIVSYFNSINIIVLCILHAAMCPMYDFYAKLIESLQIWLSGLWHCLEWVSTCPTTSGVSTRGDIKVIGLGLLSDRPLYEFLALLVVPYAAYYQ
uniref:Uncharacterized protein n=1 Tax=Glossina pallidipes TaxID=7398 RepID=A0A1A9ZDA1_GLOPL